MNCCRCRKPLGTSSATFALVGEGNVVACEECRQAWRETEIACAEAFFANRLYVDPSGAVRYVWVQFPESLGKRERLEKTGRL